MIGKVMEVIGLFMSMVGMSCMASEPTVTWLILGFISLVGMGITYIGYKMEDGGIEFDD